VAVGDRVWPTGVADIDRAVWADDRAVRAVEPGFGRGAAVAALALAAAGDRRHHLRVHSRGARLFQW